MFGRQRKTVDFLFIRGLIVACSRVMMTVSSYFTVSSIALMGVQCEQEGDKHTALGGSGVWR